MRAGARDERRVRRVHVWGGHRAAWQAAGATSEGTAILLHYLSMRLAADLRFISDRLPVDMGVMSAAAGTAEALKLLLEVTTVRSREDPRAQNITTNLARAAEDRKSVV